MALDHLVKAEIRSDFARIEAILGSGVLSQNGVANPLFQSALTELLIRVRDLMAKSEKHAKRISFTDDVTAKGSVRDVTDLIAFIRNAVCHIESEAHNHDEVQARISFNTVFGKACLAQIGETRIESHYSDDIAFFFGPQRLYLKRHIVRAYEESAAQLRPLVM